METANKNPRLLSSVLSGDELKRATMLSHFIVMRTRDKNGDKLRLLPSDMSAAYPLEFRPDGNKLISGEINFYNKSLFERATAPRQLGEADVTYPPESARSDQCIFVNLLDNCFGHALLKLFNLKSIYETYHGAYDIIVISPRALAHFIPSHPGLQLCVINLSFGAMNNVYDLDPVLQRYRHVYKHVDIAALDDYAMYESPSDLTHFFSLTGETTQVAAHDEVKSIVFYERRETARTWHAGRQATNIIVLFESLREFFPGVRFVVLGDPSPSAYPVWIDDRRTSAYGKEVDFEYNQLLNNCLLCIGVMGSHMVFPSMFCDMTAHIVPSTQLKVAADDIVRFSNQEYSNPLKRIFIHCEPMMSDISPQNLSDRLVVQFMSKIAVDYRLQYWPSFNRSSRPLESDSISQAEYFRLSCPHFDLRAAEKRYEAIKESGQGRIRRRTLGPRLVSKIKRMIQK